jgi:hypothetical protein
MGSGPFPRGRRGQTQHRNRNCSLPPVSLSTGDRQRVCGGGNVESGAKWRCDALLRKSMLTLAPFENKAAHQTRRWCYGAVGSLGSLGS